MLGERLRKAREYGKFSLDIMSEKIGVSKRTLQNYEKNDKEPTVSTVLKVANNCHIDEWWLLSGKGEMLLTDKKETTTTAPPPNNGYEIEMLNVRAGAGGGVYNYEVEVIDKIVLDKAFFRAVPDINNIKIIEVDGDSMEPTLSHGDFIIVDESKKNNVDGVYAIQLDGQLLIKRLEFNLDSTVSIISDNPRYSKKVYDAKETQVPFHIVGMKTLSIQK